MESITNITEIVENKTFNIEENSTGYRLNNIADVDSRALSILVITSTIASVGIVSNLTVIVVFLNHKKLRRKIPNIFIINQSSADLLCSVVLLLSSLIVKDALYVRSDGVLGDLECSVWNGGLLLWAGIVTSTWNLVCLTVERYLELVHPIWYRTHFKMRYIYMAIAFVWMFGLGLNASYMIPTGKVIDGYCRAVTSWPNDTVKTAFGIGLMFVQFFIPVLVLIICYGQIIWVLTTRINTDLMKNKSPMDNSDHVCGPTDNARPNTKAVDLGKEKFQLARRNTIKTLLIVGLGFIICWSQNQIMYFMYNCGYNINFNTVYFEFTILMVFLNCTVNPFIYLIKYRDYQEALKQFLICGKGQEMSNSLNSSTISISQTSRPTQA